MNKYLNKIMDRFGLENDSQLAGFLGITRMAIKRIRDGGQCSTLTKLIIYDRYGYGEVSKALVLLMGEEKYRKFKEMEKKYSLNSN